MLRSDRSFDAYTELVSFTSDRLEHSSVTFRSVGFADGEALAALRVEAMRPSLERVGRFDPERARARFLASFQPEYTREILAAGVRIGFFVLRPGGAGLLLDHLYIRPSHQSLGIGAAVLRQVFHEADVRGMEVRVGALKDSNSNRFYIRHGFVMEAMPTTTTSMSGGGGMHAKMDGDHDGVPCERQWCNLLGR